MVRSDLPLGGRGQIIHGDVAVLAPVLFRRVAAVIPHDPVPGDRWKPLGVRVHRDLALGACGQIEQVDVRVPVSTVRPHDPVPGDRWPQRLTAGRNSCLHPAASGTIEHGS